MFKQSYAIVSMMTVMAIAPAFAEQPLQVKIPFDFTIGSARMNAGDYTVKFDTPGAMWLVRNDGKASYAALTIPLHAGDLNAPGKLVFNRYGNSYFLSQVWSRGYSGRQLKKSRAELETARAVREAAQTTVAVSVH